MNTLFALFLIYVFVRGFDSLFVVEKKPTKAKCKRCGVEISAGEDHCYYCEIGEYRIWKKEHKVSK